MATREQTTLSSKRTFGSEIQSQEQDPCRARKPRNRSCFWRAPSTESRTRGSLNLWVWLSAARGENCRRKAWPLALLRACFLSSHFCRYCMSDSLRLSETRVSMISLCSSFVTVAVPPHCAKSCMYKLYWLPYHCRTRPNAKFLSEQKA